MDYMNLGIKSRKTGIKVKENIRKDAYSMENVDDFFGDEDSSIQMRRKSRKSSLLPAFQSNTQNKPLEQSPGDFKKHGGNSPRLWTTARPVDYGRHAENPTLTEGYEENTNNDDLGFNDGESFNETVPGELGQNTNWSPKNQSPASRKYVAEYGNDNTEEMVHLTPPSVQGDSYRDVPDLIDDDDLSRANTTLNTSDNALLEDELDDDYKLQSEEDADYVEGLSTLEGDVSSDTDDGDNSSDSISDRSVSGENIRGQSRALLHGKNQHGYISNPSSDLDSDEEFIQSQAHDVVNDDSVHEPDGKRKSTRVKIAPLEYWRNEKVIYKRKSNKPVLEIDKVITYENEEEEETLNKRKSKRRTRPYNYIPTGKPRGRPKKNPKLLNDSSSNPNREILDKINAGQMNNSEWLRRGMLQATINVSANESGEEVIAFAPNLAQSEKHKDSEEENFSLAVLFDKRKEHFASGILKLPNGGKKQMSDSYNAFFSFYLIEGVVEITIGNNSFICINGASFQIPAYNKYALENKGESEAKMYFVQVTAPNESEVRIDEGLSPAVDSEAAIDHPNVSTSAMSISET